ncbi:MAG: flagellar filament capping protein FliD [Candidatus Hydrogenedentota bacterium]
MSGAFTAGGLITGLDSNELISQLIQLERQPILRMQSRIAALEEQREAIGGVRTQLQTLRNRAQDFGFEMVFGQFQATSSQESVLDTTLAGGTPAAGTYTIEVLQLASATIARSSGALGAAIDPNVPLSESGITTDLTAGDFTINGTTFTFDPDTQSLNDILSEINSSGVGVTATYDAVEDKVTLENDTAGDTSIINLGTSDDTSNFLSAIGLTGAHQSTGANGSTVVTSSRNLGAVDPGQTLTLSNFANGAVTAGSFRINGIQINVDPTTDTLEGIIGAINASDANVTASYDSTNDTIRVVSDALGSRTIAFESGTSNFLDVVNLTTASQTAGNDAQFTVDGGPVQTRNTNTIANTIAGVTMNLRSVGSSTVSVETDNESILEGVRGFVTAFNDTLTELREQTGDEGALENDTTLTLISNQLQYSIFSNVEGLSGPYQNLVQIGITTGDAFDSEIGAQLELDEETFLEALQENPENVEQLFSNTEGSGIANTLADYLESATSTTGFLNQRIRSGGTIDSQIQAYNNRIERLEYTIEQHEQRYREQFARLEQMAAQYQAQGTSLSGLSGGALAF